MRNIAPAAALPKTATKAEQAYQSIRNDIIDGIYKPGTPLYIREFSNLLHISRTPVKEAMDRLAYEGYVDLLPERYAIVSRIDYSDVVEILELRECLEVTCARLAALRRQSADLNLLWAAEQKREMISPEETRELSAADSAFHLAIAKASYNGKLIDALKQVQSQMARVNISISKDAQRKSNSSDQHNAIIKAIAAGDTEGAQHHMSEHIQDILASVQVYQYNNYYLFK
jgi:DNA-binding GntR family transcriptional regulator